MRFLKYFLIFGLASIALSALLYIVTGGHVLFLMGGIPLVFGGYWTFGKDKQTE